MVETSDQTTQRSVPRKILIVDDHQTLAENLAEILCAQGEDALIAHSAERGLQLVGGDEVAILITDHRLPGKTGVELIREIRRRGHTMPIIFMSAYTDDETIREAFAVGASVVMAKPVDLDELTTLVKTLRISS